MKITVNGEPRELPPETTTVELVLKALGYHAFHAVAVNGDCIVKSERPVRLIHEGDEMEILSPQQGG